MEETPTQVRAMSQKIWPCPEFGAEGDWNPSPATMVELESVGYDVQPAAGPPPSTKKLMRISAKPGHITQYDIMLSLGNAMSGAPIISGIVKLPNAPVRNGMITKKIITVACMLKNML